MNEFPYAKVPGRQIAPDEHPTISARKLKGVICVPGDVTLVDEEKMRMTVVLRDNLGTLENVTITQPFAGNSSFIHAVPEEGSMVVMAYQEGQYFPLTYLPNYTHGLENRNVKNWPDTVKNVEENEHFFRVKKIQKGEIALGSSKGVEVHLGEHFKLDDRSGNSLVLRTDENSIINTACNNSIFSSGVWLNTGIIKRNSVDPSNLNDAPNIIRQPLPEGRYNYVLRPTGPNLATDPYYTEYLLEVDDKGYALQPENDINGDSNKTNRKPIAIFSMGNLVGNNTKYPGSYGRILRPVLFHDVDDSVGDFTLEPVAGADVDAYSIAMCWFKPERANPETGAFFGIDKEGHLWQYLPSATAGGLGKGRSMSILAKGSKKEIWGNDTRYATSWDLKTTGGIVWDVGVHNEKNGNPFSNRSIDIRAKGSVFYMYGSQLSPSIKNFDIDKSKKDVDDPRNYFKVEKIGGKERHETSSNRETIIKGSDKIRIEGARTEQIIGANTTSVGSNMNVIVGDASTEKVSKEKQEVFGNRKTLITSGSAELQVKSLQGDIKESILVKGGKFVNVKLGNIQDDIAIGNRAFNIKSGNFTVQSIKGDMLLSTKTGQISFKTVIGKAEIKASMDIDIRTNPVSNVNVQGGAIKLKGKTGMMGGVITSKSHLDFVTGAPHKGSLSVSASV
jgi:hypothetical protein